MSEFTVQLQTKRQPTIYDVNWAQGYVAYWVNADDETEQCKRTLHTMAKTTKNQERILWLHRLAGYMTAEHEVEVGRYVRFSVHPILGLGRFFDEGESLMPLSPLGAFHALPTADP